MRTIHPIACCEVISDAILKQMLITDYYDGPLGGFIQCPTCSAVYYFRTLDWSRSHLVRIIVLSLLPTDSMEKLLSFFEETPPKSQWIPKRVQRANDRDLDQIEAFIAGIVAQAKPPSIAIAWNIASNEVISGCPVSHFAPDQWIGIFDADTGESWKQYDWFRELGIERDL